MDSYPASVSPNSSAILTLTVLASQEEVLAVLRTAALLARTFKAQLSVDLPEKETLVVDPEDIYAASQLGLVDAAQVYLQQPMFARHPEFCPGNKFYGSFLYFCRQHFCAHSHRRAGCAYRQQGEVNHVGRFLCRDCDRLFCSAVEFHQGGGPPLGAFDGIRHCWNRRCVSVRLLDVRPAAAGKILRW
jgi:hypothetical protein